jgi:hypothetical protein
MDTRRTLLMLAILATGSAAVFAQVGGVKAAPAEASAAMHGALAADRARFAAALKADVAGLNRVLADELTYCHSTGKCEGKAPYVESLASGKTRYTRFESTEQKPRLYGQIVLINGRGKVTVIADGKENSYDLVYTDAFVKRDGRYQMIAWQSTRLPPPEPAK